nr:RNA-directed DNA polymerase, eukaryota [Tanacetum cinerariifolium]
MPSFVLGWRSGVPRDTAKLIEMAFVDVATILRLSLYLLAEMALVGLGEKPPIATEKGHMIRFLALGWHLEEIHVTWAYLEKKQKRLRTCTKIHQEVLFLKRGDGVASIKRCRRDLSSDGVWILVMASQRLRKPTFVCIAVHTSRETQVRRKDTICHIINLTSKGDLRKFSDIGAWYAIEDCVQYDKKCSNPTRDISDEKIANPNAQIVRDDMVMVQVPRCMAWLNYDKHVDSLSTMDNEVGVTSPESTIQTLPSLEEYTLPVTYLEEVKKILGTPIEVEPLNKTKLEEVGLNFNHSTPLSSREVPSFDKPEPQLQPLPNCPPLDASLEIERGLKTPIKPPIKPQSPDSFRMKVLDNLTIHTPHSSLVVSFHLMDLYCYYRPCIDDLKKHFRFKPGNFSLKTKKFSHTLETASGFILTASRLQLCKNSNFFQVEKPICLRTSKSKVYGFLALRWHLEEIHVTWAHLKKKQTRLQTCTKIHQEVLFSERRYGVASIKRRHHDLFGDGVWILATASQRSRLKVDLEPTTWRRRQERKATLYKTDFRVFVCLRKLAFVCIAIDTSREMRVRKKDTIRVISSIHGPGFPQSAPQANSVWNSIVRETLNLKMQGVDLLSYVRVRVGNGLKTKFWKDPWIDVSLLCHRFPRVFSLEDDSDGYVADKLTGSLEGSFRRPARGGVEAHQFAQLQNLVDSCVLSTATDRWVWTLNGDGIFRVKDARNLLDENFLPKNNIATRWVKFVPIKVNVFAWKVSHDRIPTHLNLIKRGVYVYDHSCPICKVAEEDSSHLFFKCELAAVIFRMICRWWDITLPQISSYDEWLFWFKEIRLDPKRKLMLEGVFYISWWSIWSFRNRLLFEAVNPRKDTLFDDIVSRSYLWCHARCRSLFSWKSKETNVRDGGREISERQRSGRKSTQPLHRFFGYKPGQKHFLMQSSRSFITNLLFNKRNIDELQNGTRKHLRPGKLSPRRSVPDQILKPPYVGSKKPPGIASGPEVHDEKGIEYMRASGRLAAQVLQYAGTLVKPGITTDEIDREVHQMIIDNGAYPSPLGYGGFPKSVCTSVNECICHGIPDSRELEVYHVIKYHIIRFLQLFVAEN